MSEQPAKSSEVEGNKESEPKKSSSLKRWGYRLALLGGIGGAGYVGTEHHQAKTNDANARLDHAVSLSEMTPQEKVKQLIGTTLYGSDIEHTIAQLSPERMEKWLSTFPDTGLIHLYGTEMESIEAAKEKVAELRTLGGSFFVSADIEGGLVSHLQLTKEDLEAHGAPAELFNLRLAEYEYYLKKYEGDESRVVSPDTHPLPSQEWLGETYRSLETEAKRLEFLQMMQGYGLTIARICEEIGINFVFGPVLNTVSNTEGDSPIAYNDRAYSEDYKTVADLAIAYLAGFKDVPSVVPIPKHFYADGLSIADPHDTKAEVEIDGRRGTALLPFRDVINFAEEYSPKMEVLLEKIRRMQVRNAERREQYDAATTDSEKTRFEATIAANQRIIDGYRDQLEKMQAHRLRELFIDGIDMPGLMTSSVAGNIYAEQGTPVMYSTAAVESLGRAKDDSGFGFSGFTITDDAQMESATNWIEGVSERHNLDVSTEALSVYQALAAGNEIALISHIAGSEEAIADEVVNLIAAEVDLDENGQPDLTEQMLTESVEKLFELKAQLGLVSEKEINGDTYYVLNPDFYDPSVWDALAGSFFSNQWPWLSDSEYYEADGRTKGWSDLPALLKKAVWNFSTSVYAIAALNNEWLHDAVGQLDRRAQLREERWMTADQNEEEIIIVDKSARFLWRYNQETRELIESFPIGIGKGGMGPRRIPGDHVTPSGTYQFVQRRDDPFWQETFNQPLPKYYGGADGGMLVFAGPWAPEIATHGSDDAVLGEVSNGCIRLPNMKVAEMMHQVPLGSFVVITD